MSSHLPNPNKVLGQHYLKNRQVIKTICDDFKEMAEAIIEVGPGPGILTEQLSTHQLPFAVIEKDQRFHPHLIKWLPEEMIHIQDALTIDWPQLLERQNWIDKKVWLVSNLPYNVSSQLLIQFLQVPQIEYMTLMFQKEVGDKILPPRGKNAMGSLHALTTTYFETKKLIQVSPGSFSPPPKVESIVITLQRKNNPSIALSEFKSFESFLRKLYQFKRKQLGTVLKPHFEKSALAQAMDKLDWDTTVRAEGLSLEDVHHLYRELTAKETV